MKWRTTRLVLAVMLAFESTPGILTPALQRRKRRLLPSFRRTLPTKQEEQPLTAVDELRADPRCAAFASLIEAGSASSSTVLNFALRSGLPSSGSLAVSNRMFDSVVPPSSLADASLLIDDCDVGGDASPFLERQPRGCGKRGENVAAT